MTADDEQLSEAPPGRVELRSDVATGIGARAANIDKKWLVLGSVVAVLLAILALLLIFWSGGQARTDGEEGFGLLPEALDSGRQVTVSGLSGRSCEGADRRPVAVMLAADPITRPVSGFAGADMVWELPVLVNDVTRLLAAYQCGRPDDIGSVRSARHDYLFLAEGMDAVLGHWGGSYHALNRIAAGEFETINALTNPFGAYFRKNHLPAPYNGFTSYENLWNALEKLGYRTTTEFNGYEFKDDAALDQRPPGGRLNINWPGMFRVHYEYDRESNRYQRYWGGTKQLDGGGEKEEVKPSAVVVMRATNEFAAGPGGYNDVGIEGEGEMTVYQDGGVIQGRWRKNELQKKDPAHFLDTEGKPVKFTRGQLWVMAVEPGVDVSWEVMQDAGESVEPSPQLQE